MRTCVTSFAVAGINDESRKPMDILYAVPSHSWNMETERIFDDITNEVVALSGMRFFFVTRQLVLSVSEQWNHQKCMTLNSVSLF